MDYINFRNKKLTDNEANFIKKIFIPAMGESNLKYLYPQFELKENEGKFRLVDFVFIKGSKRYAIEIDSYPYHADSQVTRKKFDDERKRQNFLTSKGYEILRFTCDQVYKDSTYCIEELKKSLIEVTRTNKKLKFKILWGALIILSILVSSYYVSNLFYALQELVDVNSLPLVSLPEDIGKLDNYVDKYVRVRGKVFTAYRLKKSNTVILDFIGFKCVIFKNRLLNFLFFPEKRYWLKNVEVWGKIKIYKDMPEIILNHKKQIKIIK